MRRLLAFLFAFALVTGVAPTASAISEVTVAGAVFEDTNRNGARDMGEAGMASHGLYLFTASGALVRNGITASDGSYRFDGLPPGNYLLTSTYDSWTALRTDWVPTTTGSLMPEQTVNAASSTTANLGWRRIVRSTVMGAPISATTGPTGLRVESYNDVVTASQLHATLATGTIGAEATHVLVRFALGDTDMTSTSAGEGFFAANVYVSYWSWLSQGAVTLAHEYGHAWSLYRAYMVWNDPSMAGYLAARNLTGDPRLNTSHAWNVTELIAEDYRQLLGPPSARSASQENAEIPRAADVPGLAEWLGATPPTTTTTTTTPPTTTTTRPTKPCNPKKKGCVTTVLSEPVYGSMTTGGAVPCIGDGTSGSRVQAVYVHAADLPDRYAEVVGSIGQWAGEVSDIFRESAAETGGVRDVRWVTDAGCQLSVLDVELSANGDNSFDAMVDELASRGLNRRDRHYLVWADAMVYCGIGDWRDDDRAGSNNANNGGPRYARVDTSCWGLTNSVEAHELMHTFGAVQYSAPNSTGGGHCTDDYDRMCYADGGGIPMTYPCLATHERLFDCGHDDYFHTAPPAGSYLSNHWNAANSVYLYGAVAAPKPPKCNPKRPC